MGGMSMLALEGKRVLLERLLTRRFGPLPD